MTKFKTYLVGGAVRDEILGVKPKDLDFVMMAPSFQAMRDQLLSEGAQIFVEKPEYVTIRCHHPLFGAADFACARKDGNYTDGRRPDEVFIAETLEQDLARRDFTIGAIAKDMESGQLFDPFNGQLDIKNKMVCCVGNPLRRFEEDRIRIFRAIRFCITKGFAFEAATITAMVQAINSFDFDAISTERIKEELDKMFCADWKLSFYWLEYFNLDALVEARGIWFTPTTKKRVMPEKPKQNFIEVMG